MTKEELIRNTKPFDPTQPYIFISYDHSDKTIVWRDVCALHQMGFNIWLDEKDLNRRKNNWKTDVAEVVKHENCRLLLFYLSSHSLRSINCCRELSLTENRQDLDFILVDAEEIRDGSLQPLIKRILKTTLDASDLNFKDKSESLEALFGFKRFFENGDYLEKNRNTFCGSNKELAVYYDLIIRSFPDIFEMQKLAGEDNPDPQSAAPASEHINQEITFSNGNRYIGQVIESDTPGKVLPHWIGKMVYPDGYEYFGEWTEGRKSGIGKLTYPEGQRKTVSYFGEWKEGQKNGIGATHYQDGNTLIEHWAKGAPIRKAPQK